MSKAKRPRLAQLEDDTEAVLTDQVNLRQLLPGEIVHAAVQCVAQAGDGGRGLVVSAQVGAGTLLLRSTGLVMPTNTNTGNTSSVDIGELLGLLVEARAYNSDAAELMTKRIARMAPHPMRDAHREGYVKRQRTPGSDSPSMSEYKEWLGEVVQSCPQSGLADGDALLQLLVRLSDNGLVGGLCCGVALVNHSCRPNCTSSFQIDPAINKDRQEPGHENNRGEIGNPFCAFELRALEDIPAGSELSISYLNGMALMLPRHERIQRYATSMTFVKLVDISVSTLDSSPSWAFWWPVSGCETVGGFTAGVDVVPAEL